MAAGSATAGELLALIFGAVSCSARDVNSIPVRRWMKLALMDFARSIADYASGAQNQIPCIACAPLNM